MPKPQGISASTPAGGMLASASALAMALP
jgi:hypothetical protein